MWYVLVLYWSNYTTVVMSQRTQGRPFIVPGDLLAAPMMRAQLAAPIGRARTAAGMLGV
jgi:hypothetical protein